MTSEHEWLQAHLVRVLDQIIGVSYLVVAVPQGVVLLKSDGKHILIRIDDATLKVAR